MMASHFHALIQVFLPLARFTLLHSTPLLVPCGQRRTDGRTDLLLRDRVSSLGTHSVKVFFSMKVEQEEVAELLSKKKQSLCSTLPQSVHSIHQSIPFHSIPSSSILSAFSLGGGIAFHVQKFLPSLPFHFPHRPLPPLLRAGKKGGHGGQEAKPCLFNDWAIFLHTAITCCLNRSMATAGSAFYILSRPRETLKLIRVQSQREPFACMHTYCTT